MKHSAERKTPNYACVCAKATSDRRVYAKTFSNIPLSSLDTFLHTQKHSRRSGEINRMPLNRFIMPLLSWTVLASMLPIFTSASSAQTKIEDFSSFPLTPNSDTLPIIRGQIDYGAHTPITLARPGVYRLTGPLSATGVNTAITISANNVTLDLDGNTISGGATGIAVTGNNVAIKNGTIQNTSATGISISGSNCILEALDVIHSSSAFLLQNTNSNSITNCRALNNSSAGFSLISSYTNSITNSQALNTDGTTHAAHGFVSHSGYGNSFKQCTAQNTQTSSTTSGALAAGFLLATEQASSISESQALGSLSLASTTTAYGIFLYNTQNCICTSNSVSNNTTLGGLGIGISADSSQNYIARNTAAHNDINYTQVASTYITAQANDRGVYNIDASSSTVDSVATIDTNLPLILPEEGSIQSKADVISSKIDPLQTKLTTEFWSIESKADVISSKIDPLQIKLTNEFWSIESKADVISSKIDILPVAASASIVDQLAACDATPIIATGTTSTNKTDITADVTLSTSGCYCLSANLGNSTTGASLAITGNNITVDLNGYTIDCDNTKATGITITGNEVIVRNGTVQNATANGISLSGSRCSLENLDVINSPTGFYLSAAYDNSLTSCRAHNCTQNGFLLSQCQRNAFDSCRVITIGGSTASSATVHGFYTSGGQKNTFTYCSVEGAYTNYANANATAQGFRIVAEDYDIVNKCTINGVSTTSTLPNLYGIRAPLTLVQSGGYAVSAYTQAIAWLENNNNRYLALGDDANLSILKYTGSTQLTLLDSSAVVTNTLDWLKSATSTALYVATGGSDALSQLRVYQFTEPNNLTNSYIASYNYGASINSVDWLTSCTSGASRYYVALGGNGSPSLRVCEFTGTSATLTLRASKTENTPYSVNWLTIGPKAYLAVGESTGSLKVIEFTGNALTEVTAVTTAALIWNAKWLTTTNDTYYLAVSHGVYGTTFAHPMVEIYAFDPSVLTLTRRATYSPSPSLNSGVLGIAWLPGIDDLNYLAIGYKTPTNIPNTQILRFDGQCLTPLMTYLDASNTGVPPTSLDWLITSSTLLATGIPDGNPCVRTRGFSPTRNSITNNTIANIHGGATATAYAVEANNLLNKNTAYNNDINYFYTPEYGDSNYGYAEGQ